MEGSPLTVEDDAEKSSDTKKSKKKARELGSFIVESKPERPAKPERRSFEWFEKEDKPAKKKAEELDPLADETREEKKTAEAEPVPAAEAPTESVGEAEVPVIEAKLVEVIRQAEGELPPDPDTDAAVEYFRDLVEAEKGSDAAYEQVMSELGAETADIEAVEEEAPIEEEPQPEANLFEEELIIDHSPVVAEAEPEDETAVPVGAGGGHGGATPPPTQQGGPGGGTPTGPPPRGPQPFGAPNLGGFNSNAAPPTPATRPNRQPHQPEYRQASPAAMALFGGIIGYLIGRRRGRIKTEKKLLPVQHKLEKQVEDMQWQLQDKERRIRRVAAEKVRQNGPAIIETIRQKTAEKPVVERRRAPEARQLHGETPKATELLGHVVVAEAIPSKKVETKPEKLKPTKMELPPGKRVETLNRTDLLDISEKIEVDGTTLRQIYETHLVGERGLRRLVGEYLRGGDIKKALRQEIVEHEIDFERDPAMRDMAPTAATNDNTGGTATLNKLIETAVQKVPGHQEATYFRQRADSEVAKLRDQHRRQRIIDVSLVSTILALIAVVAYILLNRG